MGKNVKVMNSTIEAALALVGEKHQMTEVNAGEFAEMKAKGIMKFAVRQFDLERAVNLSVMTMNMGIMQMSSIVFTPAGKDLPLMSLDYMYIMGKRKAYLEIYDLVEEKSPEYLKWLEKYKEAFGKHSNLQDTTVSEAWYKHLLTAVAYKMGNTRDDAELQALLLDTVKVYMNQMDSMNHMEEEAAKRKIELVKKYSDRLIDEGGVSTDFFKKSFGGDFTRRFFDRVFFGTDNYR